MNAYKIMIVDDEPDILDVMLPDMDGYEVCKQIRQFSHCPILFLSSKNDEVDKILGLAVGGDDYVTKPFSPKEVAFRVKSQLRRSEYRQSADPLHTIAIGALTIDPDLFHRAVGNLVINALIHNPPTAKVMVSVRKEKQDICIAVRDNGIGISETEQARLFTRYYRGTNTKEKPEGSGLGLAIARQIVVLHGGEISVKSKIGEETEFSIRLPGHDTFHRAD